MRFGTSQFLRVFLPTLISAYNQVPVSFCLMCSIIFLFYLVRTLCRKLYFLTYRQLEKGGMYDKG